MRQPDNRCVTTEGGTYYHAFGKACGNMQEPYVTTVRRAEARGKIPHVCYAPDPIALEALAPTKNGGQQ